MERDERLRLEALRELGPATHPVAREMLERGDVVLEQDVLVWEAEGGPMHGHRVVLGVEPDLWVRLERAPGAKDDVHRALAHALAQRGTRSALADLSIVVGRRPPNSPYRG